MKYEGQTVIFGFVLGIILAGISVIILNQRKGKNENCYKLVQIEMEAFYLNSIVGILSIFLGTVSLVYTIGATIQGYWEEKGSSSFRAVLLIFVIALIFFLLLWAMHPSVVMGKYIGRKAYLKSIKSEEFTRYSKNVWASEHWIRIGERFIPKTCLLGVRLESGRHRGRISYTLLAIDGSEKYCRIVSEVSELAHNDERILEELAGTEHFYTKLNWPDTGMRGSSTEMYCQFIEYLDKHNDLDLIHNKNLYSLITSSRPAEKI